MNIEPFLGLVGLSEVASGIPASCDGRRLLSQDVVENSRHRTVELAQSLKAVCLLTFLISLTIATFMDSLCAGDESPAFDSFELLIPEDSWKEVRSLADFDRLSISSDDNVSVIVSNGEDMERLLTACAKTKVEVLTVYMSTNQQFDLPPALLLPLLCEGESSLRYLNVYTLKGNDGWSELPAEKFSRLETLRFSGGRVTTDSGKWFAKLPALKHLSMSPEFISDGTVAALGKSHLMTLRVGPWHDIACDSLRTWAGNESLKYLEINGLTAHSAEDAKIFSRLPNLRSFDAESGDLELCLADAISKMRSIESLKLVNIDSSLVAVLAGMPRLKHLSVRNSPITSADLRVLCKNTRLESLVIAHSAIEDEGTMVLTTLPHLKYLDISQTKVTDASMEAISKMHELKSLNLSSCNVSTLGFAKLASLQKLQWIDIRYTNILPDAMPTFEKLRSLEEVIVTGPEWQSPDNEKLRKLKVGLKVNSL